MRWKKTHILLGLGHRFAPGSNTSSCMGPKPYTFFRYKPSNSSRTLHTLFHRNQQRRIYRSLEYRTVLVNTQFLVHCTLRSRRNPHHRMCSCSAHSRGFLHHILLLDPSDHCHRGGTVFCMYHGPRRFPILLCHIRPSGTLGSNHG